MEVLTPNQSVLPRDVSSNGHCNELLTLQDVQRFDVHTGNVSHWSSLKRKTTQNPAVELQDSLAKALSMSACQGACKEELHKGKLRVVCENLQDIEKVTEAERPLMKATVKVFAHQGDHHHVREAVFEALNELDISHFDVVFLTFPNILENSEMTFSELAKPFWREMEKLCDEGIASHLAVCDLDAAKLKDLLAWARIKPEVNQVNLTSCCHMPQDLVEFAKQEDILLHTHGDPPTLMPNHDLENLIGSVSKDNTTGWSTRWVVRYSVVVKCRGVIKNKGYILSCDKGAQDQNGCHDNGNGVDH
eukprot:gene15999-17610_t